MQQGPALGSELWGKNKKQKNKTILSSTVLMWNTKIQCKQMFERNDIEPEKVKVEEIYQSEIESGHHVFTMPICNLQSETPAGATWRYVRHAMRSMQRG